MKIKLLFNYSMVSTPNSNNPSLMTSFTKYNVSGLPPLMIEPNKDKISTPNSPLNRKVAPAPVFGHNTNRSTHYMNKSKSLSNMPTGLNEGGVNNSGGGSSGGGMFEKMMDIFGIK
jgi:hypothetical protein